MPSSIEMENAISQGDWAKIRNHWIKSGVRSGRVDAYIRSLQTLDEKAGLIQDILMLVATVVDEGSSLHEVKDVLAIADSLSRTIDSAFAIVNELAQGYGH